MTVAAISMFTDDSGEVVEREYETIGDNPGTDNEFIECTAVLYSRCEERPTRDRMDKTFEPVGDGLYQIRSGRICFFTGVKFDASERMTFTEIVRITSCTAAKLPRSEITIAKGRNKLFQQAVHS